MIQNKWNRMECQLLQGSWEMPEKGGGGDKSKPQILVNANQLTSTVQLHKSCSTAVPRFT